MAMALLTEGGPGVGRRRVRKKRRCPEDKSFGAGLGRREAQRRRKGERAKRAKFWPGAATGWQFRLPLNGPVSG